MMFSELGEGSCIPGGSPIILQLSLFVTFPSLCANYFICVFPCLLFASPTRRWAPREQSPQLSCSLLKILCLAPCLTHSKCSIKIFFGGVVHKHMNERLHWLQPSIQLFIRQACFVHLSWIRLLSTWITPFLPWGAPSLVVERRRHILCVMHPDKGYISEV